MLGNLANHDNGSVAAYDYWTHNGFLYGKEIAQNVGPLGFINWITQGQTVFTHPDLVWHTAETAFDHFVLVTAHAQHTRVRRNFIQ